MAKKVEGALYKATGSALYFPKGEIVRLVGDVKAKIPLFRNKHESYFLIADKDVKLLKPKVGDEVRLYRLKHSKQDLDNVGYYPEQGMLKKGEQGIVVGIDKHDGTVYVGHDGKTFWYYMKDLAVIERKGVSI